LAWAAGNLVSDLRDLERFFRALLGGRLLTEMTTPVPTGQPGFGYGLGLLVIETPLGRLVGHNGAIPGFLTIVLSTEDGRRQLGLMTNQFLATPAVAEAFDQAFIALAIGLLQGAPLEVASTSASQPGAAQAGAPIPAAGHWRACAPGWPSTCSIDRPTPAIGPYSLQPVSAAGPRSHDHDTAVSHRRGCVVGLGVCWLSQPIRSSAGTGWLT
jgi:hypothetical protein